jgi:hypothetical protein
MSNTDTFATSATGFQIRFSDGEGITNYDGIAACLFTAYGPAFDCYMVWDLNVIRFGADAEMMRSMMNPGTKMVRVQFPDDTERDYTTVAAARRAIIKHVR